MGKTLRIFTLVASVLLSNGARADGPLEINIGGPSAGYYTLYVAQELGLFEKQGLIPKFYWFTSGAPLLAGLKSKSIDVTTTGLSTVFCAGARDSPQDSLLGNGSWGRRRIRGSKRQPDQELQGYRKGQGDCRRNGNLCTGQSRGWSPRRLV